MKKYERYSISAEEFIRVWQSSKNVHEIAEKTGLPCKVASARASFYRSKGIPLKRFHRSKADWERLAELAKEIAQC